MKTFLCLMLVVSSVGAQSVERTEDSAQDIPFAEQSDNRRLLVDNLAGSIVVEGYDGDVVHLTARRTTRATSERRYNEASEDITLEVVAERDRIEVVVESPWRDRWGGWERRGYEYYGYRVRYDLRLKVPKNIAVYLRTIDEGDIEVRGIEGRFEVKNVNGSVSMNDIAGYGRVATVNGSLDLSFSTPPTDDCAFRTVNGEVNVIFPTGLSAVLVLKTFNGKAYTDFDFMAAKPSTWKQVTKRGRTMYKLTDRYAVQVGDGGPRIAFDTLNGDITIKKQPGT